MEKSIVTMQLRKATFQVFRRIRTFSATKAIFAAYLFCSILLSMFIIVRFSFAADSAVKTLNIALYWGLFFIIPSMAVVWLLTRIYYRGKYLALWLSASLYIIFRVVELRGSPVPEYLFLWLPVALMVAMKARWSGPSIKPFKRGRAFLLASSLAVAVLLPHLAAVFGANILLNQAAHMSSERERASFISGRVIETTAFGWAPRANTDYWKFLLSGAGRCGEMAIAGTNLMSAAGLAARRVALPGEDHAFIEVMIDNVWFVADPGYYGSELLSREQRTTQRAAEFGAISYVIAYTKFGVVELTQSYVPTDAIVIRVTYSGEPLVNAQVYLVHKFMGRNLRIPDSDSCFFSDSNGTVVLHLGASTYADKAQPYESQFRIYVNGEDTGYRVGSKGTGETQIIEIDLPGR